MRACLLLIAFVVVAPRAMAEADGRLPTFDVQRNCGSEATDSSNAKASKAQCVQDEANARKVVQQRWPGLTAETRRQCTQESSIGGDQSYVELLTCLQMSSDWKPGQTVGQAPASRAPR